MGTPITRKFPDRWCHRTRIWWPDKFRGSTHASYQIEGGMDLRLGEFLKEVLVHGVDEGTLDHLKDFTKALKARRNG